MAYRLEYNGEDIELATLDDALDRARRAITIDVGRVDGWAVERDEAVDDWFVQGVRDGKRIGPTAVVSDLDPVPVPGRRRASSVVEEWERRVSFVGETPAEAFALAAAWLERRPDIVALGDVGWHHTPSGHQVRLYYRGN